MPQGLTYMQIAFISLLLAEGSMKQESASADASLREISAGCDIGIVSAKADVVALAITEIRGVS